MLTVHTELMRCPHCGEGVDAHARPGLEAREAGPADGDMAVCGECAGINVYAGGQFRKATTEDFEGAPYEMLLELRSHAALVSEMMRRRRMRQ